MRRFSSVETFCCTSVFCSDKRGTLTANEMTVLNLANILDSRWFDVRAVATLCNDGSIIGNDDVKEENSSSSSKVAIVERIHERTGEPKKEPPCVYWQKNWVGNP